MDILEEYFPDAVVTEGITKNSYEDICYNVYVDNELVVRFIMDCHKRGILRVNCCDSEYKRLSNRIRNSHVHHEYDDKMLNIWDKAEYSNPLHRDPKNKTKVVQRTKRKSQKKSNSILEVNKGIQDEYIYIVTKVGYFYLLINNKVKKYSKNTCPIEIKKLLEAKNNMLVAFNTGTVTAFFRNSGININCSIDVRIYLRMNGYYDISKLKELADTEGIKLINAQTELRYLQKCFLRLKDIMSDDINNVLEDVVIPYNCLMNDIIFHYLHIDKDCFHSIYDNCSDSEQEDIDRYFKNDYFYDIDSFGITKTFRFTTQHANFQGLPINAKPIIREICKAIVPSKDDSIFVDIDFKHMDVSSLCFLSKDSNLIHFIVSGKDVYTEIAKLLFEKNTITASERKCVKEIILSFIYGASQKSVAKKIGTLLGYDELESASQAKKMNELFADNFPNILKFRRKVMYDNKVNSCIKTPFGTKIEVSSDKVYTACVNNIVQSTSSFVFINVALDIMEKSRIEQISVNLVMQKHDELLFEVDASEKEKFIEIIEDICMLSRVSNLPMPHTLSWGENYYEILKN